MKIKRIASILAIVYIFSISLINSSPLPRSRGYAQLDTNIADNSSVLFFIQAKDSMYSKNMTSDDDFLYVGSDGGTIVLPNVKLGYGSAPNDIFSIVASIDLNAKGGCIEVRKDKEDGEILGTININAYAQKSDQRIKSFHELNTGLYSNEEKNCDLYIVFKGDCSGRYYSFKITGNGNEDLSIPKTVNLTPVFRQYWKPDQIEISGGPGSISFKLEDAEGNPIAGQKIFLEKSMDAWEIERYSTTDSYGIANFNYNPNYNQWTRRDVIKASFFGNYQYKASFTNTNAILHPLNTPTPIRITYSPKPTNTPKPTPKFTPTHTPTPTADPKENKICADINKDNVINIADAICIGSTFNSIKGDALYKLECDLNRDDVINMMDIVILAKFFGQTT